MFCLPDAGCVALMVSAGAVVCTAAGIMLPAGSRATAGSDLPSTGPTGPAGPVGASAIGLQGPQGPTGPSGSGGSLGPTGEQGATGPVTLIGPDAPTGPTGTSIAPGRTGPTGQTGPPGPTNKFYTTTPTVVVELMIGGISQFTGLMIESSGPADPSQDFRPAFRVLHGYIQWTTQPYAGGLDDIVTINMPVSHSQNSPLKWPIYVNFSNLQPPYQDRQVVCFSVPIIVDPSNNCPLLTFNSTSRLMEPMTARMLCDTAVTPQLQRGQVNIHAVYPCETENSSFIIIPSV